MNTLLFKKYVKNDMTFLAKFDKFWNHQILDQGAFGEGGHYFFNNGWYTASWRTDSWRRARLPAFNSAQTFLEMMSDKSR